MNAPLKKNYLERIRSASIHSTLRLVIDLVAGLALLGIIGAAFVLFTSGHPWLALYDLASIALLYATRSLAVLVVDIADMLIEQGAQTKVGGDHIGASS